MAICIFFPQLTHTTALRSDLLQNKKHLLRMMMIMIVSHRCLMSNASFTNKSDMSGNIVTILHAGKPSPLTEEKEKKFICILHYS